MPDVIRTFAALRCLPPRDAAPLRFSPSRASKRFFFEKKNQETFASLGGAYPEKPKPNRQKFFASFFQKGSAFPSPPIRPFKATKYIMSEKNCLLRIPSRCTIVADLLRPFAALAGLAMTLPVAFAPGGCTAPTTILSNADPTRAAPADWADYQALPVDVHGAIPGHGKADLAALFPAYRAAQYASMGELPAAGRQRRMVLYVNPAYKPELGQLCDGALHFPRGTQHGQSAYVVGALCDGSQVITTATAKILTKDQDIAQLDYNFNIIRDQLYLSLFPGANDPDRYYEGY